MNRRGVVREKKSFTVNLTSQKTKRYRASQTDSNDEGSYLFNSGILLINYGKIILKNVFIN